MTSPLLIIDNTTIDREAEFNFLGINLNEQFNWKVTLTKCQTGFQGVLNKLKQLLPLNIKIILYNPLILPHLNYGVTTWDYKYIAHTESLFKSLTLLKISEFNTNLRNKSQIHLATYKQ